MPQYPKTGKNKRRFEDNKLPDYHLHCRYCFLHGLSMSQAATLWNEKIKNKYSDRNEQLNLLFAHFRKDKRKYVPKRQAVKTYFREGEKYLSEIKRRKRDRALVNYRLQIDNYECQNCGFPRTATIKLPKHTIIIEVHHIYPIEDGERETKIEDLVSLCPNCHKLIHAIGRERNVNQLPVERLKNISNKIHKEG